MLLRLMLPPAFAAILVAGEAPTTAEAVHWWRINDGRWIEREAVRVATAMGDEPKPLRAALAALLWRSRELEPLDLGRPALIAWRTGRSPLLAAVPMRQREPFLAAFGCPGPGEPPLVRIGDRDGTAVLSQVRGGERWEYRMLARDGVAWIARTREECERLAGREALVAPVGAPAIEAEWRGAALAGLPGQIARLADALPLPGRLDHALPMVPGLGEALWADLMPQIARVRVTAGAGAEGSLVATALVEAVPDSALAVWLGQQRDVADRLPAAVRSPDAALVAGLRLTWQGQAERWLLARLDLARAACGPRWGAATDTAWRTLATLVERCGPLALACELPAGGGGVAVAAIDHPRAGEVVAVAGPLLAALGDAAAAAAEVGGQPAARIAAGAGRAAVEQVVAATERHLVVAGDRGGARALAAAQRTSQALAGDLPPGDGAALAVASLDLAVLWRQHLHGEAADPVPVTLTVRCAGTDRLAIQASVPLTRMAALVALARRSENR